MLPQTEIEVRPATVHDRDAIRHLLAHTPRPTVHAWPWENHLGDDSFQVALHEGQIVGALFAYPDAGPVAWVRLAALGNGFGAGPWLDASLPPLVGPLRCRRSRTLAWMDVGGWAGPSLRARGFYPLTQLVTLLKDTRWLPPTESSTVHLRTGGSADVPALARLDHAAFSPHWWLSAATLEQLRQESICFLIAEQEGRQLGYVEIRLTEYGAHVDRLAVTPHAQGRGVGGLLLAGGLEQAWRIGVRRVTLNTQEKNLASRRLYTHFGFRPVGERVLVWERAI